MHAEVERETDRPSSRELRENLERVLGEVRAAVEDWQPMRDRRRGADRRARARSRRRSTRRARRRPGRFLRVGRRRTTSRSSATASTTSSRGRGGAGCEAVPGLRPAGSCAAARRRRAFDASCRPKARALARDAAPARADQGQLALHRAPPRVPRLHRRQALRRRRQGHRRAPLPRPLHDAPPTARRPRDIPLLRGKVDDVLERAGFPPGSHDDKALIEIIETYPRDELFQIERRRPVRRSRWGSSSSASASACGCSCAATARPLRRRAWCSIPRDRFNTENRERVGEILLEAFGGSHLDWTLQLSESVLVRVHYIVHCPDGVPGRLRRRRDRGAARRGDARVDRRPARRADRGARRGARRRRCSAATSDAFPPALPRRTGWRARRSPTSHRIEQLAQRRRADHEPLPAARGAGRRRCAASCSARAAVSLSDVLPMFEHMGAKVVDERPVRDHAARRRRRRGSTTSGCRCAADDVERGPRRLPGGVPRASGAASSRTTGSTGWCSRGL